MVPSPESTAISGLTDKNDPVQGYITIRSELGRYIRYGEGQEEFYDTSKDPHEWSNQIDDPECAEAIATLKAALPGLSEMATPMPRVRR